MKGERDLAPPEKKSWRRHWPAVYFPDDSCITVFHYVPSRSTVSRLQSYKHRYKHRRPQSIPHERSQSDVANKSDNLRTLSLCIVD